MGRADDARRAKPPALGPHGLGRPGLALDLPACTWRPKRLTNLNRPTCNAGMASEGGRARDQSKETASRGRLQGARGDGPTARLRLGRHLKAQVHGQKEGERTAFLQRVSTQLTGSPTSTPTDIS